MVFSATDCTPRVTNLRGLPPPHQSPVPPQHQSWQGTAWPDTQLGAPSALSPRRSPLSLLLLIPRTFQSLRSPTTATISFKFSGSCVKKEVFSACQSSMTIMVRKHHASGKITHRFTLARTSLASFWLNVFCKSRSPSTATGVLTRRTCQRSDEIPGSVFLSDLHMLIYIMICAAEGTEKKSITCSVT